MRNFTLYKQELTLNSFQQNTQVKKGATGLDVIKIQEWINLNHFAFKRPNATAIDGDFGDATATSVRDFQAYKSLPLTGEVDQQTFFELSKPLRNAFEINAIHYTSFRELICKVAHLHFENNSKELTYNSNGNRGPWVRSYCNGSDKEAPSWCLGFVKTIFDIACDLSGAKFNDFLPDSLSCDAAASFALNKNKLIRRADLPNSLSAIRPGDLFFKYTPYEPQLWHHVGIITQVFESGIIEAIEGNSKSKTDTSNGDSVNKNNKNILKINDLKDQNGRPVKDTNGNIYEDYYEVYTIQ